jgi:hypothetical protein
VDHGVLVALLAYASFSWGDAVVKSLGGLLPVFAIGLFLLARPRHESWRDFWRMGRPWTVQARRNRSLRRAPRRPRLHHDFFFRRIMLPSGATISHSMCRQSARRNARTRSLAKARPPFTRRSANDTLPPTCSLNLNW